MEAQNTVASGGNVPNKVFRVVSLPNKLPTQIEDANTFCSNVVITSKYTTWNFLPKFLYESFRKLANAYFLLVSILQTIPSISNTGGIPSNLPVLIFILGVDATLAIIEDRRRHHADREANRAKCHIITATFTSYTNAISMDSTEEADVSEIYWSDLTVGTIVKLKNRETAPADLLILSMKEAVPEEPTGICYIETKSLDGETNLKLRHALECTTFAQQPHELLKLCGYIECEQPNRIIGRFDGTVNMEPFPSNDLVEVIHEPLTIKNVILRGCQLRNTDYIYGLVLNTGRDTKIMQSASEPPVKWSSINETVNKMIVWLFSMLCLLCIIATTTQCVWIHVNERIASQYLQWTGIPYFTYWWTGFGYYFLLMYQMIPVSLYVTISMVMFFQALFMTWDMDLYHVPSNQRMIVRSLGLNEELGQISYVFSDKTGTLTCNVMEFRKCCINGIAYGNGTTEVGRAAMQRKGIPIPPANTVPNKDKVPFVDFNDPNLTSILQETEKTTVPNCLEANFFLHLSLCHTVIPERVENSKVRLSASSPDEQALVSAASYFGYVFESRGLGIARIRVKNRALLQNPTHDSDLFECKILNVLEFTSDRKRMSVIVQHPNHDYFILTKGADNVILPLLSKSTDSELIRQTLLHLQAFADEGLRTLTIAQRQISAMEYKQWSAAYQIANASMDEMEKRNRNLPNAIDDLMTQIERDLELLGATAIEDKLQDHVSDTIFNLARAGMKIWMLTGDKQETAINIAYACQLLNNDMRQYILNCELYPSAREIYAQCLEIEQSFSERTIKALIIDGECLEIVLNDDQTRKIFASLAMQSESVICCRVSPSQKALVISLVRSCDTSARTLAIGDGANDVAMIQRAHIGVGISGQEGLQAVNSSDYAIAQFMFLEKLLLHHGRLNYKRMSVLVGYMFYKNIVMVLAQYLYTFYSGASGQKFYAEFLFQLYNLCYTSLPIIALGVLDYDVPWKVARQFPQLYLAGPNMECFNNVIFFKWIASSVYEATVICLVSLYAFNASYESTGEAPMLQYGVIVFTMVVLVCNLKLCLLQMSWNWIWAYCWFIGVLACLPISVYISSNMISVFSGDYGIAITLKYASYWFLLLIGCFIALLRHSAWIVFQRQFYPFPWQIVQEKFVLEERMMVNDSVDRARHVADNYVACSDGDTTTRIQIDRQTEESVYLGTSSPVNVSRTLDGIHSTSMHPVRVLAGSNVPLKYSVESGHLIPRIQSASKNGFAFSFDPSTTMAESYMSTHSLASASSAISNAEHRERMSSKSSRSSDFSSCSLESDLDNEGKLGIGEKKETRN